MNSINSHCFVSNDVDIMTDFNSRKMIDTQHSTVAFWEENEKGDHDYDRPVKSTADHFQRVDILLSNSGQMVSLLKIMVELIGIEPTTS